MLLDLKCPPVEAVGNYNGTAAASVPERFFIIMQLVGRVINIQIRVGDFSQMALTFLDLDLDNIC